MCSVTRRIVSFRTSVWIWTGSRCCYPARTSRPWALRFAASVCTPPCQWALVLPQKNGIITSSVHILISDAMSNGSLQTKTKTHTTHIWLWTYSTRIRLHSSGGTRASTATGRDLRPRAGIHGQPAGGARMQALARGGSPEVVGLCDVKERALAIPEVVHTSQVLSGSTKLQMKKKKLRN